MGVAERSLDAEEREEITEYKAEALQALGVAETDSPKAIAAAIRRYVHLRRAGIHRASEDDYAWLILSMAYLWGDQVCRAYGWQWVMLVYDTGEGEGTAIVPPDRAIAVHPILYVKEQVDHPDHDSTILLLFNMLVDWVLDRDFPDRKAGTFQVLW